MGQLTSGEVTMLVVVIAFGLAFFAAVTFTIISIFKRLARQDQAETEHFTEPQNDAETTPQSDILEP